MDLIKQKTVMHYLHATSVIQTSGKKRLIAVLDNRLVINAEYLSSGNKRA
jgi:hypothetical protein